MDAKIDNTGSEYKDDLLTLINHEHKYLFINT
jgi:hypothetical protein